MTSTTTAPASTTSEASRTVLSVRDLQASTSRPPTASSRRSTGSTTSSRAGKTLGIVGESGSGKSVSSAAILGLHNPKFAKITGRDHPQRRRPADALRCGDAQAPRARGRDDLPGPALGPAPLLHGRQPDHRGLPGAQRRRPRSRPGPVPSRCSTGSASRNPDRRVDDYPAPVLRRDAPARDDRDGADQRPRAADRGRADHGARRDGAGADPRPAPGPAARVQLRGHDHHPRPGRRRRDGRRRAGDVRRTRRRVRPLQGDPHPPRDALHLGAALQRAGRQGRHRRAADPDPRATRPACSARPAGARSILAARTATRCPATCAGPRCHCSSRATGGRATPSAATWPTRSRSTRRRSCRRSPRTSPPSSRPRPRTTG